jgi:hypothetical protein
MLEFSTITNLQLADPALEPSSELWINLDPFQTIPDCHFSLNSSLIRSSEINPTATFQGSMAASGILPANIGLTAQVGSLLPTCIALRTWLDRQYLLEDD